MQQQHPWETGWAPLAGQVPQSDAIATKVIRETTYHLFKDQNGNEVIQKNGEFYQVSPGAWNTIPPEDHLVNPRTTRIGQRD